MINGIPKISVLIICYKQEELIKRAINSLLAQKDYIYEICVSDDCSPDKTWEVLQEYDRQYPGLFKIHRNEPNIGIFENIEYTWTMPTGDIIYQLAGDDECGEGWFKTVINYIQNNKIDYKNELFCIYGDYKAIYPNGDSFVACNNLAVSGLDVFSLSLRKHIGNRSVCYSKRILNKFIKVSSGNSYAVEASQDRQVQLFTERNYYINHVGNIYYTGVGVSSSTMRAIKIKQEREHCMASLRALLNSVGYKLSIKDSLYMDLYTAQTQSYRMNGILYRVKLFTLFIRSIEWSLGFKAFSFKRVLFAIVRRVPHSKPLSWTI